MKVYITKYALTTGIFSREAKVCESAKGMIEIPERWQGYFHKPDWHETFSEAQERAESMRAKKITSLKKQLAKLESLRFDECKDLGV